MFNQLTQPGKSGLRPLGGVLYFFSNIPLKQPHQTEQECAFKRGDFKLGFPAPFRWLSGLMRTEGRLVSSVVQRIEILWALIIDKAPES